MDAGTRAEMGIKFLRSMYGNRKVSLARATITDRGKTTQTFHEGAGRLKPWSMSIEAHVHNMVKKSDQGTEIFYSPVPMSGDKGRKKEQALPNVVVFGDADEGLTADAKAKLVELGACLVRSGGKLSSGAPKYHVYLLLTKEVEPNELERLNRGLKAFIRGDKFDSTTLLRIPGTRNHKYPGAPLVEVERYADARHTPENLIKFLGVEQTVLSESLPAKLSLPHIPEGFNWRDNKPGYARMRKVMREWDQRFDDPHQEPRRYMAAIAIVKDALKYGVDIDTAYAFAERCKPLQDKAEEENGYSIQKDIAKIWRREAGMKPSGTLTADDIVSAQQNQDAKDKTSTTPPVQSAPPTFTGGAPKLEFGPGFPFARPNLDELLSGDYKPLEPTLVTCGSYFLLYPGKSHGLSSDRGLGKTHVTIAMIHDIMKRGGRVAYFDFEDSADTFIRDRMMNQHGITEEMVRNQFLYLGGIAMLEMDMISPTEAIEMLAEQIKDWDLVVIDGVSASMSDWSVDEASPSPMLDGSKATDYAWWHNRQVKPFLDQGVATLQIDHSTKQGGRVGGTIQKGAKLTGVEYELRPEKLASNLVMGGTGRLVLAAVKDRVGRIIRYKRRHVPAEEPDSWHDVAVFVMTSSVEGKVSRAEFEPVNRASHDPNTEPDSPAEAAETPLSEHETRVLDVLKDQTKPITRYALRQVTKLNNQKCTDAVNSLVSRGLADIDSDNKVIPIKGTTLDFSKADKMPRGAVRKLECHNCGDQYEYPKEFVQADEEGYIHTKRTCRACAGENISREPEDGAEWARKVRGRITRRKTQRGDS